MSILGASHSLRSPAQPRVEPSGMRRRSQGVTQTVLIAKWKQRCRGGCNRWLRKGRPIYKKRNVWVCKECFDANNS